MTKTSSTQTHLRLAMSALRVLIAFSMLAVAPQYFPGSALQGAEPPQPVLPPPWADPQAMFDHFFGKEDQQDEKALAEIEVSLKQEQQLGKTAVSAYLAYLKNQKIPVVSRGKDVEYLRALVETVRPLMTQAERYRSIKVYVAQSSRCDARSFPGGTLVFSRGLLESADSEAAVVGIVGHELAHLDRGHHLRRIRQWKLAEQTFSGEGGPVSAERFFGVGTMMARMFARPFRPEYEAEADRDADRWAYLAGYDPRELAKLLLQAHQHRDHPALPIPEFFRTHPPGPDRHQAITDLYDELRLTKPQQQLYIGTQNLRRRVPRAQRQFQQ